MTEFNEKAHRYIGDIDKTLQAAKDQDLELAICDVIPGIAFREIWPYDHRATWSPLETYGLVQERGVRRHVPRKHEPGVADWLLSSFRQGLQKAGRPKSIQILCIGDGENDISLAEQLNDKSSTLSSRCSVNAYIYGGDHILQRPHPKYVHTFKDWKNLASQVIKRINNLPTHLFLLIVDIDQTLVLPRGLGGIDAAEVTRLAFRQYAQDFSLSKISNWTEIDRCHQRAAAFKPYITYGEQHYQDEDARVFAALARAIGLFSEAEWAEFESAGHPMGWWLEKAARRCRHGGWNPTRSGFVTRSPGEAWNGAALAREFDDQWVQLAGMDCCFSTRYRHKEAAVLKELTQSGRCKLNGHIVDIISAGTRAGRLLPVAYSDRPSASVGLQLMSYYKSRPRPGEWSLINEPLQLIREAGSA